MTCICSTIPAVIVALATTDETGPKLAGPRKQCPHARAMAAELLGAFGLDAKEALPTLKNALQDEVQMVREAAKTAIAKIQNH